MRKKGLFWVRIGLSYDLFPSKKVAFKRVIAMTGFRVLARAMDTAMRSGSWASEKTGLT